MKKEIRNKIVNKAVELYLETDMTYREVSAELGVSKDFIGYHFNRLISENYEKYKLLSLQKAFKKAKGRKKGGINSRKNILKKKGENSDGYTKKRKI